MKQNKHFTTTMFSYLMVLSLLISLFTVFPTQTETTYAAAKPKLNQASVRLIKGESTTLNLKNATGNIQWKSKKKAIASVSKKGVVKARKKGSTQIVAKYKGKSYKCKVWVETPSINQTALTLTVGQTETLTMKGTKQLIAWSSQQPEIAGVDANGAVTAKAAGTAEITAAIGNNTYACKVTVTSTAAEPEQKPDTEQPTEPQQKTDTEQPTEPEQKTDTEQPEQKPDTEQPITPEQKTDTEQPTEPEQKTDTEQQPVLNVSMLPESSCVVPATQKYFSVILQNHSNTYAVLYFRPYIEKLVNGEWIRWNIVDDEYVCEMHELEPSAIQKKSIRLISDIDSDSFCDIGNYRIVNTFYIENQSTTEYIYFEIVES